MLRRYSIITTGVLVLILFTATQISAGGLFGFGSSVKGSGDLVTESRDHKTFNEIKTSGSYDINVTIGAKQKITITFDDNLIDLVETNVKNNTLRIRSRESFSSRHSCVIEITVPDLKEVSSSGSGDISVHNIDTKRFEFDLTGSGDFFLEGNTEEIEIHLSGSGDGSAVGKTGELEVKLSGSGDIDTRDLIAKEAYVRISGSGDLKVFAENTFDGAVSGSGNITYYGKPEHISTHVSGSGRIRRK